MNKILYIALYSCLLFGYTYTSEEPIADQRKALSENPAYTLNVTINSNTGPTIEVLEDRGYDFSGIVATPQYPNGNTVRFGYYTGVRDKNGNMAYHEVYIPPTYLQDLEFYITLVDFVSSLARPTARDYFFLPLRFEQNSTHSFDINPQQPKTKADYIFNLIREKNRDSKCQIIGPEV